MTEPFLRRRIDPRRGRLSGLVSTRFARVVCKEIYLLLAYSQRTSALKFRDYFNINRRDQ